MAFGGLLHFQVNEVLGKNDYFMAGCDGVTDEYIYVLCHPVNLIKRSLFQNQTSWKELMINTLNGQGIAQPGEGQALKAVSDNDIIEGISVGTIRILLRLCSSIPSFILNTTSTCYLVGSTKRLVTLHLNEPKREQESDD